MKKSFLILFLSIFFISCSNEDQNVNLDQEKVQFVLNSKNTEVTNAAYQLLNPEEKYFIWNERIDYILNNEDLSAKQKDFINKLKSDLNTTVFKENSEEGKLLKSNYNDANLSLFEPIQAYYYFGTLANMSNFGTWTSIADAGNNSKLDFYRQAIGLYPIGLKSCNCNGDSMFDVDCSVTCSSDTNTNSGCGFLWLWPCEYREKI